MAKKEFYQATAMLLGTIVGAGILGIPYVIAKAGFLTGILLLLLIGGLFVMLNLFMGEIALRTKGNHQLTGYAEKYLGKWGKYAMTLAMIGGLYGALVAYFIGEGQSLAELFGFGSPILWSWAFYIIFAYLIYLGIKAVAKSELIMLTVKLIAFFAVFAIIVFSGKLDLSKLAEFDITKIFIPYGVIVFSYIGAVAIPEMKEILIHDRKLMKKAILIGAIGPLILYAIFAFAVIGVTGTATTEVANVGLSVLGTIPVILINLFAILAMGTSFLTIALAIKEMYKYDYKLSEKTSWALTITVPIILILLGVQSFAKTVGTTGAIAGGLEGILIVLMFWQAKKKGDRKPEYSLSKNYIIGGILILVLLTGALLQVKNIF